MHSSVDGHLVCSHVLAIVNSAAMNIGEDVFLNCGFFLGMCPGVGLLEHMVILFLVFRGTSLLFSTVATPTYIPTNSVGRFPFLCTLPSICYL